MLVDLSRLDPSSTLLPSKQLARFTTLLLASTLWACEPTSRHPSDAGDSGTTNPDAGDSGTTDPDAGDSGTCDPACHWDCFGGFPQCSAGTITWFGSGPRPCCGPGSGTSHPDWPVCATAMTPCASASCGAIDPRYAQHVQVAGSFASPGFLPAGPNVAEDAPRLLCAATTPVEIGSPCETDRDCRPAPASVTALRCDISSASPTCVEAPRPTAAAEYGTSCGVPQATLDAAPIGESITFGCGSSSSRCQIWNDGLGCTAQRCTVACFFDEDCPDGSVCISAEFAIDALPGYCAPATDRTTEAGRFGPTGCP